MVHELGSSIPSEAKLTIQAGRGKHQGSIIYTKPADEDQQSTLAFGYGINLPRYSGRAAIQSDFAFQPDKKAPSFRGLSLGFGKTLSSELSLASKYELLSGLLSYHAKYRLNNNLAMQGSFQTAVGAGRGVFQGYRHYPFNFGITVKVDL
jgi:hypothetical protein